MLIRVVHKSYSAVFMVEGIPSCGRTMFCVSAPQLVDVMGNFFSLFLWFPSPFSLLLG